jgi:hypothetical protein
LIRTAESADGVEGALGADLREQFLAQSKFFLCCDCIHSPHLGVMLAKREKNGNLQTTDQHARSQLRREGL